MSNQERSKRRERPLAPGDGAAAEASPDSRLRETRQQGQDLLDAGDEAISRALSGDSTRFLQQNRQLGGQ